MQDRPDLVLRHAGAQRPADALDGDVADVQPRVRGGLDQQQRGAVQHALGPGTGRGHLADLHAERGELGVGQRARGVVTVRRQDDRGARPRGEPMRLEQS